MEQDQPEASGQKIERSAILNLTGISSSTAQMGDYLVPNVAFKQILSHLSLKDLIELRGVSKNLYSMISNFRVTDLCCSDRSIGFIHQKSRWLAGAFGRNLIIGSARLEPLFEALGQSVLSNLNHLRLCDLRVDTPKLPAFVRTISLFKQLKELDIIRFDLQVESDLNLNLPLLNSIQLEKVFGISHLTVDAPKLKNVKLVDNSLLLRVGLAQPESVEKLIIDDFGRMDVKELKYLAYLYCPDYPETDSTMLSTLEHLKEIHLQSEKRVAHFFEPKQACNRVDFKIYLRGLRLDAPNDPAIIKLTKRLKKTEIPGYLVANQSRLAEIIPIMRVVFYSGIERLDSRAQTDLLKRYTDLNRIWLDKRVQDVGRLFDLLDNCGVSELWTFYQPQNLFDQLPDRRTLQSLQIQRKVSNLAFLARLTQLNELNISGDCPIDIETIRTVLLELQFLQAFTCYHAGKLVAVLIDQHPKKFNVSVWSQAKVAFDVDAVLQFILAKTSM